MSSYKLFYFNNKGPAEVIRHLFALAEQPYQDIRYSDAEFKEHHKKDMPFNQMPVLEIDGKQLPQSGAIYRFLARRFGFAGKTPFEEAMVDAVSDQIRDFYKEAVLPYLRALVGSKPDDKPNPEKAVQLMKELVEPGCAKYFPIFEKILSENQTGYVVGDSLTYADVQLAHYVKYIEEFVPGFFDAAPEMLAHKKRIHSIPTLKRWLEISPVTPY